MYGTPDPIVVDTLWASWAQLERNRRGLEAELAQVRRAECEVVAALLGAGLTARAVAERVKRSHSRVLEMARQVNESVADA